jgi:RHS repeat-associated protein
LTTIGVHVYDRLRHLCIRSLFPPYHFTGKERDAESGNDYFEARHYNSAAGRFLSPDWSAKEEPVPYAKLDDPQSLNLYSYVRNNPMTSVDVDGHWPSLSDVRTFSVGFAKGLSNSLGLTQQFDIVHTGQEGGTTFAASSSLEKAGLLVGTAVGLAAAILTPGGEEKVAVKIADDAHVVRGGVATAEQLAKGAETVAGDGKLSGISVQSANGASVKDLSLSGGLKNNQVSVTTAGEIRATGAEIKATGRPGNPHHCDLCNVDANRVSRTFKQQPNPAKVP